MNPDWGNISKNKLLLGNQKSRAKIRWGASGKTCSDATAGEKKTYSQGRGSCIVKKEKGEY